MFGFGLVTVCQGLVQGYGGIITTRFFLGFFEAGMFPGKPPVCLDGFLAERPCRLVLPHRDVVQA